MKKTIFVIIVLAVLAVAACTQTLETSTTTTGTTGTVNTGSSDIQLGTQELKKFNDIEELKDYLARSGSTNSYNYGGGRGVMVETMAMDSSVGSPAMAPSATKSSGVSAGVSGGSASDYSQTNVQVEGVDEADYVKNDDKYIYVLSQEKLVIINAYPAKTAEILSKTEIDGNPRELFVNGDKLVVFTETNDEVYALNEYDFIPEMRYTAQTHALLYDITDRSEPELINDYALSGNYFQSRMIGDNVYFLVREGINYYNDYPILPRIVEKKSGGAKTVSTMTVVRPDIYYFDNPDDSYTFTTIASLDVAVAGDIQAKTYLLGWANTLYVSENNIYIAYQKNEPYWYGEEARLKRFYDVIVPNLPSSARAEIESLKDDEDLNEYERWEKISDSLDEMYNTMDENAKDDLVQELREKAEEYEMKIAQERQKSVIHKIAIKEGNIDYKGKGEVPGTLLNQFSLDEYKGELRVATTSDVYTRYKSTMYNNVYILDSQMEVTGELEGLAEDERIYSTRFIGDRLYMVTFKRMDPLFVIDMSGRDPEVLGKLKIPGFSDYLHPYDENHLIGVGKETEGNEWGGVSVKGIKIALFDVTDVTDPEQVDMVEIGTSGSDSEALNDHEAFLFDKEKNLLVLPVREVRESYTYDGMRCGSGVRCYPYRQSVWQGAYVFTVTEKGFEKKGRIDHYDGDEDYSWYWGSPYAVKRSLFMDDVLYTLSAKTVKMNDLDTLNDVNEIELPYRSDRYYGGPVPMRDMMVESVMVE